MPWNLFNKKCDIDNKIVKLNKISGSLLEISTKLIFDVGKNSDDVLGGTNQRGENTEANVARLLESYMIVRAELLGKIKQANSDIENLQSHLRSQSCSLQDEIDKTKEGE